MKKVKTTAEIIASGVKCKRITGENTFIENNCFTIEQVTSFISRSFRFKMEATAQRNGVLIGKCWKEGKKWNWFVDKELFESSRQK